MNAHWLIAKYVPDLRRREPVNVGVLLHAGGEIRHRFVGEREDGEIDGRSVRSWVGSTSNYKRWVRYWRHAAANLEGSGGLRPLIGELRSDDNYFLEFGGERLFGTDGLDGTTLLERLYTTLVEEVPPTKQLDVSQLTKNLFQRLDIAGRVRPFAISRPLPNGASDRVRFDFRYDNGQPNLLQRVSLTYEDDRSWNSVHATSWAFREAHAHFSGGAQHIALVKTRPENDAELEQQLQVLEQYSNVVDVGHQTTAASQLRELLHLHTVAHLPGVSAGTLIDRPPPALGDGRDG